MSEFAAASASVIRPVRLVGRDRELVLLRAHLAAALAGRGGIVLLGGEAGIGKTALAEVLLAEARDRGALVLIGRCYDLSETPPYGPWHEAFEAAPVDHDLPALPVALLPVDRDSEKLPSQGAIIRRVREYLAALGARQPLVLLLDDLHWADPVSLDLLRAVGRYLTDLPLLILATYRDDEPTAGQPWAGVLPALVREARAERLTVSRLGGEATRAFAHARYRLPAGDEARLADYLHARAEGNPFYLGELLRSLEEAGLLRRGPGEGGWTLGDLLEAGVPPLLRLIIGERVARLGTETGQLLAVAAVIGQAVPLDLWAAASGADDETLGGALDRVSAVRMLAETPDGAGARFAHALIRETLYEAIPLPRRRGLHRRVAEALLVTAHPDPDAVAGHFQRAGDPRAIPWLIQAGHRALRAFANLTAAARYETALTLLGRDAANPGLRGWCLLYLSQARYWDDALGGIAQLEEALRLSDEAADRTMAAYARYLLGYHRCALGDFRLGIAEMVAGAAALDTLTAPERAAMDVLGRQTFEYVGTLMLRFAYVGRYAEAQQMAQRILPKNRNSRIECALGEVHAALGQAGEALQAWTRARTGRQRDGDHWNLGLFIMFELHGTILPYRADDLLTRRRLADESERAITAAGDMDSIESARVGRLSLLALEGDWAEARTIAEGVCAGNRTYHPQAASILAAIAYAQGGTALAHALIRRLLPGGPAEEPGGTWHFDALRQQRLAAELALDAGGLAVAQEWLAAHDRWLA
jgi:tetratricopeptide (TPR) repeat protein